MEFLGVNVQSGMPSEDFSVDDLLNLANDEAPVGEKEEEEEEEEEESRERKHDEDRGLCSVSGETGKLLQLQESSMEITFLENDDLADLEWLSQLVDDSFDLPEPSPALPAKSMTMSQPFENRSEPDVDGSLKLCLDAPVPGKARSKRARTGGRVWSHSLSPFSSSPSSSASFSTSGGTSQNQSLQPGSFGTGPTMRRHKKKMPGRESWTGSTGQPVRRCSHCGVQKTPQWRAGPMGAKTLCNACGVRFKSGRLLPEYRPACSPTFCSEMHSNHHRKVLEMRRKKELSMPVDREPTPNEISLVSLGYAQTV